MYIQTYGGMVMSGHVLLPKCDANSKKFLSYETVNNFSSSLFVFIKYAFTFIRLSIGGAGRGDKTSSDLPDRAVF